MPLEQCDGFVSDDVRRAKLCEGGALVLRSARY